MSIVEFKMLKLSLCQCTTLRGYRGRGGKSSCILNLHGCDQLYTPVTVSNRGNRSRLMGQVVAVSLGLRLRERSLQGFELRSSSLQGHFNDWILSSPASAISRTSLPLFFLMAPYQLQKLSSSKYGHGYCMKASFGQLGDNVFGVFWYRMSQNRVWVWVVGPGRNDRPIGVPGSIWGSSRRHSSLSVSQQLRQW
jgi:hypothetical protein